MFGGLIATPRFCRLNARLHHLGAAFTFQIDTYQSIWSSIKSSDDRMRVLIKLTCVLLSFVTVYHFAHSMIRLVSVPYNQIQKYALKNRSAAWNSPKIT